ncbi:MAG: ABC-F family ATP-binding cassette domain-containing protein [Janthinobacterium lividum]
MAPPLLLLQDIHLSLGSAPLLAGAELGVGAGERICLVGRNGSGKSTLLKVAAGLLQPDGGTRFLQPGTTVRYLPQEPDLSGFATTLDYVQAGMGPGDDEYRAAALLDQLGLTGREAPDTLSGGQQRRAALARTLAPSPDLLLLDEPTNHLDLPAIEWLETELTSLRAGLVLISHDRRLLETLSRSLVWLDGGVTRRVDRGFAHFETWREEIEAEAERDLHKLGRQIAREEDWLRYGVTARRKRNVRRVGELHALRQKRRDAGGPATTLRLASSEADLSGKLVSVAKHVSKSYGPKPVVQDLTLRLLRGDRLGIVGPNGAGKTTLLNLLTGKDDPDSGSIAIGTNLQVVTLDQQRAALDPAATLSDTLTGGGGDIVQVGDQKKHVIGYMKEFLFKPEQARTPVGVLSGGERGRLLLACAMARPSNLIVLDEPTNDLDLETLDLLQDMLADYPGTVLLVSHDRDFLDRVVTSTLAAEGAGRWVEYAGGYSDMLVQRGPVASAEATARRAASKPAGTRTAAKKMSFKDKHALETLPAEMEAIGRRIAVAQRKLDDPKFYGRDPAGFKAATATLNDAQAALAAAEERWLALEMMREELGA